MIRENRRLFVAVVLTLSVVACGDGSPTAPTGDIPQVAGTYNGPIELALLTAPVPGTASMVVVQSGAELTITGSVTVMGDTFEIPMLTGTVDENGFFMATAGGFADNVNNPICGTTTTTSSSLTFSDSTAVVAETATTELCGPVSVSGTLTRA